jgi:hypothetical protein
MCYLEESTCHGFKSLGELTELFNNIVTGYKEGE